MARFQSMSCAVCGSSDGRVLYRENFRPEDLTAGVFSARRTPDRIHYQVLRCPHDGMVWSSPVLVPEEANALYSQSSFSYADELNNLKSTYLEALGPALSDQKKDARILEVGCGNGFMLEALRELGYTELFGVEPGREAVAQSPLSLQSRIVEDVFRPGLFQPGSFDLIFFFQTLDHVYDPGGLVAECARLLKPGGRVVAFQHDVDSWSARLLGEASPIIDVEHIYLFNARTARLLLEKHGFEVEHIQAPANRVSFRHLVRLAPLPRFIKDKLLTARWSWLAHTVKVKLGNLCVMARIPVKDKA